MGIKEKLTELQMQAYNEGMRDGIVSMIETLYQFKTMNIDYSMDEIISILEDIINRLPIEDK